VFPHRPQPAAANIPSGYFKEVRCVSEALAKDILPRKLEQRPHRDGGQYQARLWDLPCQLIPPQVIPEKKPQWLERVRTSLEASRDIKDGASQKTHWITNAETDSGFFRFLCLP
jgi:hypothetical protein